MLWFLQPLGFWGNFLHYPTWNPAWVGKVKWLWRQVVAFVATSASVMELWRSCSIFFDSCACIFPFQRLLSLSPASKMPCQEVANMTDQQVAGIIFFCLNNIQSAPVGWDSQQYIALSLGAWLGELLRHCHDGLWRSALGWGRGNSRQSISTPERLVFMKRLRGSQHQGQRWYIILQDLQILFKDSANLAKECSTWPTTALNTGGSTRQKLTSLALAENWWDDNFSFYNTVQLHY